MFKKRLILENKKSQNYVYNLELTKDMILMLNNINIKDKIDGK
jgi:hypothetical protein